MRIGEGLGGGEKGDQGHNFINKHVIARSDSDEAISSLSRDCFALWFRYAISRLLNQQGSQ
jgi:hypothetical protein